MIALQILLLISLISENPFGRIKKKLFLFAINALEIIISLFYFAIKKIILFRKKYKRRYRRPK